MDVVSSYLVVFQVSFFILHVQLGHINGQSLYETPRDDPLKDSEAHSYYRKVYGKKRCLLVIISFLFQSILSSLAYNMRTITSNVHILTCIKIQAIVTVENV